MIETKPLVDNVANPKQVKDAKRKENWRRRDELDDLKYLLTLAPFRRFVWRYLDFCSVFGSIWHPSALIHHSSGKQDVGHKIMADVTEADPESFIKMMIENKRKQEEEK